jgi:hypothetical protein
MEVDKALPEIQTTSESDRGIYDIHTDLFNDSKVCVQAHPGSAVEFLDAVD